MLERVVSDEGLVIYRSPLLTRIDMPHAFTTRHGGVSAPPFDSLNLGLSCGLDPGQKTVPSGATDTPEHIEANYRRVLAAMGCPSHRHAWVHQVHGSDCITVTDANHDHHPNADAQITCTPGVVLSIRVADCVPILLADETGRCVAAVHAGWRGVVAGVLRSTLAHFRQDMGVSPRQIIAAVGPCIGAEHFEVGPEVAEAFHRSGLSPAVLDSPGRRPHVDLALAVTRQLFAAGIDGGRIDRTDLCSFRDADDFFSHRRDRGVTGRMAALLAVRQTPSARPA
ncbi:MAG: peptidoglycan editing factor PgeF [Planctomycetes bacterium]|nr:peptidoglycan editing factor PgeF [Planctomycetota bacterium]